MPLNPQIPLAAVGAPRRVDIITPFVQAAQLRDLGQQQAAREIQLEEATRQQTERQALREIFGRHAEAGTVGTEQYLREIGGISPEMYAAERQAVQDRATATVRLEKSLVDLRKANLDVQAERLKQSQDVNDMMIQKLSACIDRGETAEGQACYERSKAEARMQLQALGVDTTPVDNLPERLNVRLLNQLRMGALSVQEQLAEAYRANEVEREVAKEEALRAGRVEEARLKAEATEASRLRVARERGVAAAERQATAMVRAAEIEKTEKPLTGAVAQRVADLDATITLANEVEGLFQPQYVGPVAGRMGGARELTGDISDQEVEFRQVVQDIKDTLLRARSGAAITEAEYRRLSGFVPNLTDKSNVFKAKLRRFRRNIKITRDAKVRIGRVGRGELEAELPPSAPTAPAPRVMSEEDVQRAMDQTGWPRQQVLDAARKKGFTTPE